MAMSGFDELAQQITTTLQNHGELESASQWGQIYIETKRFLGNENLINSDAIGGLESLGTVAPLNPVAPSQINANSIREFVHECKVPTSHHQDAMLDVARILADPTIKNPQRHFATERLGAGDSSATVFSTLDIVGSGAIDMVNKDAEKASPGLEAFGADMDKIQSDAALNIAVSIMRYHNSLIDRVIPRKSHNSNIVTVKIQDPTVYDLEASHNTDNRIRNGNHEVPMLDLYRDPSPASTQPKRAIPLESNDTKKVKKLLDGNLITGITANLFDLTLYPGRLGTSGINYTDILSEGGRVEYVLVEAKKTDPDTGTEIKELFKVSTAFNARSRYTKSPNNSDSGDTNANMVVDVFFRKGRTKTAQGVESTLLEPFDNTKLNLNVTFNSNLNLKLGNVSGSGSVTAELLPQDNSQSEIPQAQLDELDAMTFSIVSYMPEIYFSEANIRRTTRAVRMNTNSYQFEIPVARTFVVDFALDEQQPEDVLNIVQNMINLGNSDRSLRILESKMEDVHTRLQAEKENREDLHFRDRIEKSYAAGTLSHPTILKHEVDYANPNVDFLAMRQSEHLSDVHALMRENLLNISARLKQMSLFHLNLEPNERVAWKVVTSTKLQNTVMGIRDYWNTLDDTEPRDGSTADGLPKGSTYSFYLPNHDRVDVIATEFNQYVDRMIMLPVRENNPTHITSFATQYDRGSFVANYTPTNNNAAFRRAIVNSREIPHVTNPVGAMIDIKNLDKRLPAIDDIDDVPSYTGQFATIGAGTKN